MSEPVRRGRPGHDQQTVLRVAIELFNRQGYDASSMGDLARELGLTKSAIYHHVPSKEHLPAVTLLLRVRGNTPAEQNALARRRDIDHRLAEMVREAADTGAIRADIDPLLASRLLFGMVNSMTEWLRDGSDVDALADTVTTLAFDGLVRHRP
jgi:AcrR family transcriptional regulator